MPNINTFLTFNNQAEEAARFYTSIFPNSRITRITHYPDRRKHSSSARWTAILLRAKPVGKVRMSRGRLILTITLPQP
jgi:predicted 3-demethylubiquinone-9 3-methyltransferase (glyoxalase superfamily)